MFIVKLAYVCFFVLPCTVYETSETPYKKTDSGGGAPRLAHPLPNQLKFWKRKEKEGKRRKKRGRFSGVILGSGVLVLRSGSM